MGFEIHSPIPLKSKLIEKIVSLAEKHPEAVGLNPDMGIFSKYPRPYAREQKIKAGTLTREIALYIEDSYKKGMDKAEVAKKVAGMKPKPGDTAYVETVYRMAATYQDPKDLIPLIPYIKHIHGKCWEMNKGNDFSDAQITYDTVVPVLMQNGFDGYIATEYEGQRSMEVSDVDEVNEVRRQHIMLKRLLGV